MTKETNKKPKVPKVRVSPVDLKTFLVSRMTIDPYWQDLYTAPPKKKQKYK